MEDVLKDFRAVQPKGPNVNKEVSVIELSFEDKSPFRAATFLNTLMKSYLDQHLSWKTEEADATVKFVEAQLTNIRTSLESSEKKACCLREGYRRCYA